MQKTTLLITAFILLLKINGFAQQQKLDSLEKVIQKGNLPDTTLVKLSNDVAFDYYRIKPEKTLQYAEKAIQLCLMAKPKQEKQKYFQSQLAQAYSNKGIYFWVTGNLDSALFYYNKGLIIRQKIEEKDGVAASYHNIANLYKAKSMLDSSLHYNLLSLRIKEELNNRKGMAGSYNNIGFVFWEMNKKEQAKNYFYKALFIRQQLKDSIGESASWNNLGNSYMFTQVYDSAKICYENSLKIRQKNNDIIGMAEVYNNLGLLAENTGKLDEALQNYIKAKEINLQLNNSYLLASNYINIANIQIRKKDYQSALSNLQKAVEIGNQLGATTLAKEAYEAYYNLYFQKNDYKNALTYFQKFVVLKDSIFNETTSKQLLEMQTKYETEKKEREIEKQQLLLKNQTIETQKQKNQRNFFIIFSLLFIALSIIIYHSYIQKKKSNKIISEKNVQLEIANNEITAQKNEIEKQNDELKVAYKIIEQKNKNITDSIRYALRIQTAILPTNELIHHLVPDTFVLYKPKSIVSGDFYYLDSKDDFIYFAAVDCTGHGVPGAFMSMVGYTLLNQALNEKNITEPDLMLNFLSESIAKTLHHNEKEDSVRDGMDLVLCQLNKKTLLLKFAAVHNPIYIIRNKQLFEFKGEKWPLGKPFCDRFTTYHAQEYQLIPGDILYLFSDGFVDQFNHETGKKFTSTRFKEFLLSICELPVNQQYEKLNETFENWKGQTEQIDDVMVLGIKF